jgi:TolB protein
MKMKRYMIVLTIFIWMIVGCVSLETPELSNPSTASITMTSQPITSTSTPIVKFTPTSIQPMVTSTSKSADNLAHHPIEAETELIAFEAYTTQETRQDIYIVESNGSNLQNLTALLGDSQEGHPTWSPNGNKIAFTVWEKGEKQIINIDWFDQETQTFHQFTDREAGGITPAWSPDGQHIAFTSKIMDQGFDLFTSDFEGIGAQRIISGSLSNFSPDWSPDGQYIVFDSNRDGNSEIYIVELNSGVTNNLTQHPARDVNPAWSPDGQYITFESERDGNSEIYVMAQDGSDVKRLTNNPGFDITPDWSPDGQYIAFASHREGIEGIFIMDASGENITLVAPISSPSSPQWRP